MSTIPGSSNPFPSVRMIEASDPTDYPADDTGEQRMVVGPDHLLYLVDDGGVATAVGGSVGDIVDLSTAETDDTLVLAPDGAGGVEFRAEAGGGGAPTAHGARVTRASGNVSTTSTPAAVAFTSEVFDTDTIHDNSTNNSRLTIPSISGVTTGLWTIKATGYSSKSIDGYLRLNGSTGIAFVRAQMESSSGIGSFLVSCEYVLTAGDYVECLVATPAGNDLLYFDAGISPVFSIAFLGKVS